MSERLTCCTCAIYVCEGFHLRHFVDMVGTDAFLSNVVAYPGIVVIIRPADGTIIEIRAMRCWQK